MTEQTAYAADPARPEGDPEVRAGRRWLRPVVEGLVVLAAFALAGAFCGWLWEHLWTAPTGGAYQGKWYPDATGSDHLFDGTGSYVVIAAIAGVLLGIVAALLFSASELGTVLAVLAGGALAGWLMHEVGLHFAPADPAARARDAADFTPLKGTLTTYGDSYRVAFPGAALIGPTLIYLCFPGRRRVDAADRRSS